MASSIDSNSIFALQTPFGSEVSAWWVDLDEHSRLFDPGILTEIELDRSERMTNPVDARRFTASRHALRTLLASYMACRPENIRYRPSDFGKPEVIDSTVDFSLSRSQGHALIAFSTHRPVGVDIEMVRPVAERDSLIESIFSDAEKLLIQSAAIREKDETFLQIWVRKEACLKAAGLGLAFPLTRIIVGASRNSINLRMEHENKCLNIEVASIQSPSSTVAALAIAHRRLRHVQQPQQQTDM